MAKKKELMHVKVIGEDSAGILVDGEFVGNGELLALDEQVAKNLIARGRAQPYTKTESKKK